MKKLKNLIVAGLALALALSLVAGACAPAAPPAEEGAEEIAKLEADLAAKENEVDALEDEVAELEDEIAALKKPVKVQEWEPATWIGTGMVFDDLLYMADVLERLSNGRIVMTPSQPGAVCPVDEQLDAVAKGTTEAMLPWPGYNAGKIPITALEGDLYGTIEQVEILRYLYDVYEDGRISELFSEAYAGYGDAHMVGHQYRQAHSILCSKVPIYRVSDIEGVAFRASDNIAEALAALGAGTTWVPGPEIYTGLASGVFDAVGYSNAADCLAMSFHEVTDYWLRTPPIPGPACEVFVVNGTLWEGLDDTLQAAVEAANEATTARALLTCRYDLEAAWKEVEGYGIEIIDWPPEDCAIWNNTMKSILLSKEEFQQDPLCVEMLDIQEKFMIEMGYWE